MLTMVRNPDDDVIHARRLQLFKLFGFVQKSAAEPRARRPCRIIGIFDYYYYYFVLKMYAVYVSPYVLTVARAIYLMSRFEGCCAFPVQHHAAHVQVDPDVERAA